MLLRPLQRSAYLRGDGAALAPGYTRTSSVAGPVRERTARKASRAAAPVLPSVVYGSQTEIGKRLGLPQRKVSRIIASSMKSLKDRLSR